MNADRDTADCLTEADALQLVSGEGAAEEVERWRSHVGECETCRRFVAELARICVPTESSEGLGGAPAVLPSGTALGHYALQEVLGRGGMGVVYGAFDRRLNRSVALKVLRSHTDAFARLRREASVMARLSHPNVAEVYDVGEDDGRPYVVLERVEGPTLLAWWMSASRSMEDVLGVYAQAGRGLAAAHRAGLVHRDLKPGNVILVDGRVKVLDFGIARARDDSTHLTRTGEVIGSPLYMAPEQIQGKDIDGRCDLYALGVITYTMLTGREPFAADSPTAVVLKHLNDPPPDIRQILPDLPDEWIAVLDQLLAKKPDDRFPDAKALLDVVADLPV